jgi:hypothetical protein
MLSDAIVERLVAADLDHPNRSGFSFSKYRIKDDFKLAIRSLCVPIPRNFNITGTMVKSLIEFKLSQLYPFGVASQDEIKVVVPLFKREDDTPRGAVYINFESSVSDEAIAVIKNMLHNTYWDTSMISEIEDMNGLYIFNCHYARTSPFHNGEKPTGPSGLKSKEVKSFYRKS